MNHIPQISFDVEDLIFGFHNEKIKGRNTVETSHITSVADPDVFGSPGSVSVTRYGCGSPYHSVIKQK